MDTTIWLALLLGLTSCARPGGSSKSEAATGTPATGAQTTSEPDSFAKHIALIRDRAKPLVPSADGAQLAALLQGEPPDGPPTQAQIQLLVDWAAASGGLPWRDMTVADSPEETKQPLNVIALMMQLQDSGHPAASATQDYFAYRMRSEGGRFLDLYVGWDLTQELMDKGVALAHAPTAYELDRLYAVMGRDAVSLLEPRPGVVESAEDVQTMAPARREIPPYFIELIEAQPSTVAAFDAFHANQSKSFSPGAATIFTMIQPLDHVRKAIAIRERLQAKLAGKPTAMPN